MNSLVKKGVMLPLTRLHSDEFLAPFDKLLDNLFQSNFPDFAHEFGPEFFANGSYPKVDIINYKDSVVIEAEIPGLSKNDVNVELIDDVLVISGIKQKNNQNVTNKGGTIVHKELKHSSFRRSFNLSSNIDKEKINASFENGILTITLYKLVPTKDPTSQTKKIEVK